METSLGYKRAYLKKSMKQKTEASPGGLLFLCLPSFPNANFMDPKLLPLQEGEYKGLSSPIQGRGGKDCSELKMQKGNSHALEELRLLCGMCTHVVSMRSPMHKCLKARGQRWAFFSTIFTFF